MTIEVVFRRFKDGDIIALMPYEQVSTHECTSYMHFGQHSAADYNLVMSITDAAPRDEYLPLMQELERIGYYVKPIKRRSNKRAQA